MRTLLARTLRAIAVTSALTTAATLAAPPAYADTPTTTIAQTVEDAAAGLLDTAASASGGCIPYVYRWTPIWLDPIPHDTPNGSMYYLERGGAEAYLNCPAAVKAIAWVMDESARPFDRYQGKDASESSVGETPRAIAEVDVPYSGPDAPILRPYGQVTVHVEVYRKLSSGRYELLPGGCVEFYFLFQPGIGLLVSDPTKESGYGFANCSAAVKIAAYDAADTVGAA